MRARITLAPGIAPMIVAAALAGCGGSGGGVTTSAVIAPADPIVYASAIRITQGGTYTGNWQSLDPKVAAVTIATTQPVVLESANIRSAGHLIQGFGLNLIVRNTRGYAINPNSSDRVPGRFLAGEEFYDITVTNSEFEGTSGIYLRKFIGDRAAGQSIRILRNRVRNVDGRASDGMGGFSAGGSQFVQFVQLNGVIGVPGIEIAWNEVVNEPGKSRVEDNISIYKSSGTAASPIDIHDNYIQGAYAYPPTSGYSGGGIMLGDGTGPNLDEVPGFVRAHDNQVVSTGNYGIAIAAGHDSEIYGNRVVSSARIDDGSIVTMDYANGINVWDAGNDRPRGFYFNNLARDNVVGLLRPANGSLVRSDYWTPACAVDGGGASLCRGNASLPDPIDRALERSEYVRWQAKVQAGGIALGVR